MNTLPVRLLVVDDSALVRKTVQELMEGDPDIELIATAPDPYVAAERIRKEEPDVILLDVEMPLMAGLTFLRRIITARPIPVEFLEESGERLRRAVPGAGTAQLRSGVDDLQVPPDSPGIVVVQHALEEFATAFAGRPNGLCTVNVKAAETRDGVLPGRALIAPGNHDTLIGRSGACCDVEVRDAPLVCRHKPSVDVLLRSGARGLLDSKESAAARSAAAIEGRRG